MTECERYIDMISSYVDGQLSDDETAALLEHIRVCPDCARQLRIYEEVSALASEDVEVPEELHGRIMSAVVSAAAPKKPKNRKVIYVTAASLAACLALTFIGMKTLFPAVKSDASAEFTAAEYSAAADTASPAEIESAKTAVPDGGTPLAPLPELFGGAVAAADDNAAPPPPEDAEILQPYVLPGADENTAAGSAMTGDWSAAEPTLPMKAPEEEPDRVSDPSSAMTFPVSDPEGAQSDSPDALYTQSVEIYVFGPLPEGVDWDAFEKSTDENGTVRIVVDEKTASLLTDMGYSCGVGMGNDEFVVVQMDEG